MEKVMYIEVAAHRGNVAVYPENTLQAFKSSYEIGADMIELDLHMTKDGEIVVLGKARGSKQGNNLLVSEIEKSGGVDFSHPILLGYTGLSDHMLQKYITDSAALWQDATDELAVAAIGSVVGTHAGPGAIAAAFFHK